jgi:sterol desaturase/sphingolipid hydroxylase (fatty acid hydroxylase superfamily)
MEPLLWAIPIFFVTMAFELWVARDGRVKGYEVKDTAASLSMGIGNLVVMFFGKIVSFTVLLGLYEFRLFDLPSDTWWVWVALIFADDFFYYWFHRCSHEIRFFWAAHVNHHSSQHYNLSTALRQSWTSPLIAWVFWFPLPLLGFDPVYIVLAQSISLLYQYWIHTELIGKLGPLEWVFNTPSHHRVHHGSDPMYLDRNHGGILIVWDRMFGTFKEEETLPTYGLTRNIESFNPVVVAFHEWEALTRDVLGSSGPVQALGYLWNPPGWRADGTGVTSEDLRKAESEKREAKES